jgi:hypothetical protein
MNRTNSPEMSVIIATPDSYDVIRKTMGCLRAQTARERLEIVVVAPSKDRLGLIETDFAVFHSYKVVEVGEIRILTDAKVAGVLQATGPIVAFAEDHCFPEPSWAETLIAAHREGHAAVGPVMRNANPATSISWAGIFLHYGCCIQPILSGLCTNLPWHNTSYKRHLLLEYGSELASMLIVEGILFDDLRSRGHILHLEPAAHVNHVNISILSSWVRHAYWGGRLFGAVRAQKGNWGLWKRMVYIAGSPLIPPLRLYRVMKRIRQVGKGSFVPGIIPAMLAALLPHALGEATGYGLGSGKAPERYSYFEMKRFLHVVPSDRATLFDA